MDNKVFPEGYRDIESAPDSVEIIVAWHNCGNSVFGTAIKHNSFWFKTSMQDSPTNIGPCVEPSAWQTKTERIGLVLSGNYFDELRWYSGQGILPTELTFMLRSLISATYSSAIRPHAPRKLIELAKLYLSDGVWLVHDNKEEYYDITVFVPDDKKNGRPFFILEPRYPNGRVMYLREL